MSIGNKIADLRKEQKLTQKDLAEKLNVSDKVISRWETGATLPDVEMMKKIAKVLNVTIAELYDALDEDDGNADEKDNYERIWQYYDYERIWRYKRSTIISCALFIGALIAWFVFVFVHGSGVFYVAYPYDLGKAVDCIIVALAIILAFVSVVSEVVSAISLSSFSKTKYYRTLYEETLKKYVKVYVIVCSICILVVLPWIIMCLL